MLHQLRALTILLAAGLGSLVAIPAQSASLQQVSASTWGRTGVPTYVDMYIYVPDKLATNPPILVCNHSCSGNATGVFGQASAIVKAADQYGFIMVFPQATGRNCWDVGSTASLTHDGGGDTQAIAEMVKYTITKYQANADRVYSTGTSSGGMMTEALLAVYPDVFKGGAEFSGVPAGCWADGYDQGGTPQWSNNCAGGKTTFTAQQWGDKVRAMYAGYSGYRPRIQLWHAKGDPTINYNNQTEAIKEWTNVLGLSTDPTSTTTVSYSNQQWTRQSWQNSCGYAVLDVWTEPDNTHGTDANLNATYTIPFMGLDQTGATDPEVVKCGASGAGGSSGTGASTGAGGTSGAMDGGPGGGGGSNAGVGGTGGIAGSGGSVGSGGSTSSGGTVGNGGGGSMGGAQGTGGSQSSGGSGGSAGGGSGGTSSMGGVGGNSGSGGSTAGGGSGSSGCGCRLGGARSKKSGYLDTAALAWGLALLAFVRGRRIGQ
jgi:acetylxylan esterase